MGRAAGPVCPRCRASSEIKQPHDGLDIRPGCGIIFLTLIPEEGCGSRRRFRQQGRRTATPPRPQPPAAGGSRSGLRGWQPVLRRQRSGPGQVRDAAPGPPGGPAGDQAGAAFGLSRPSFYEAQAPFAAPGLPGLLPSGRGRGGPQASATGGRHLRGGAGAASPELLSGAWRAWSQERLRPQLPSRRSVERALARQEKGAADTAAAVVAPAESRARTYEAAARPRRPGSPD